MKPRQSRLLLLVLTSSLFFSLLVQAQQAAQDYYPFATKQRNLVKLGGLDIFNTNIADFSNQIRDQGAIASCASFGMMALLENQLFIERGITADFSERFHLYANFMETGTMGSSPDVIASYSSIITKWGVMPEVNYPYSGIEKNSARFQQDAAQNLKTDPSAETVDSALKKATSLQDGSLILQKDIFLGALPKGDYPIGLPLKVKAMVKGARIPEVEDRRRPGHAKIISCYTTEDVKPSLLVTPKEFAKLCLDVDPKSYFSCRPDTETVASDILNGVDQKEICANLDDNVTKVAQAIHQQRQSLLALTLRLTEVNQAVLAGIAAPEVGGVLSVWSSRLPPGGGHAVTVLGYLTYDELMKPEEHNRGLLKQGVFDKLATAYDQILQLNGKLQGTAFAIADKDDAKSTYEKRTNSSIAQLMKKEGGILFFRNSWGESKDKIQIGASGYQAMTFEYFLRNISFVMSRRNKLLADVAWQDGPSYCPVKNKLVTTQQAWISNINLFEPIKQSVLGTFKSVCNVK